MNFRARESQNDPVLTHAPETPPRIEPKENDASRRSFGQR